MTDFLKRKTPPTRGEFPDQASYDQAWIAWGNVWPVVYEATNKKEACQAAREGKEENSRPHTYLNPSGLRSRAWWDKPWQVREYRGPA